jgi:hypothetical protein
VIPDTGRAIWHAERLKPFPERVIWRREGKAHEKGKKQPKYDKTITKPPIKYFPPCLSLQKKTQ